MEDNGFFGTGANTTRVQTLGGLDKPHMVTNNRTLTAIPVPANSQSNLYFVTGESEQAMSIITGNGGYVTTSDNSNLELGDNFTLTYTGWVNTTLGSSLNATPASTLLSENGTVLWNAAQLVDGNVATQGFHTDTTGIGSWVLIDYGPDWRALTKWEYYVGAAADATWNIQYSADNATWGTAYVGLDVAPGGAGWKTATWASVGTYQYWRSLKTDVAVAGDGHMELQTEGYSTGGILVEKPGAFVLYNSGSGNVTTQIIGTSMNVTATGVSVSAPRIVVSANTTTLAISINGTVIDTVTLSANVTNNANNWVFLSGIPYASNITLSVNGTQQLWYQPIVMISGDVLPDRAGGDNNGTITWGTNPTGVSVSVGTMTSSGQPSVGAVTPDPTRDLLGVAGGGDWNVEPDVSGTLLTNPFRPIIVAVSDNTSLTERQTWIWSGIAFVVMVFGVAARGLKGHVGLAGVATGVALIINIAMTVFPIITLPFAIVLVVGGLVSERSQSL